MLFRSETFALLVNEWRLRILNLRAQGKSVPPYLAQRLASALEGFNEAEAGRIRSSKIVKVDLGNPFDKSKAYTKPIYLLVDRGCASSCESTLEAFEAHPYAVTTGENSGGYIHFGNLGSAVLLHSKVVVQMATDFWKRDRKSTRLNSSH